MLEIGTFTDYSVMSMPFAVPADGKVVTCDVDADCVALVYWARVGVADKIEVVTDPALATLDRLARQLAGGFDLAFSDADRPAYATTSGRSVSCGRPNRDDRKYTHISDKFRRTTLERAGAPGALAA